MFLYIFFFSNQSFEYVLQNARQLGIMGSLIGLGAILNLLLFFFFLWRGYGKYRKPIQPYQARGVLMATILAAFAILYFEF
jgi:NADH:ubiquinone oxidoreductase subunit 6 (subunit J)